jgi:prepilin-type N-terminal cleavage/methylation domain-containing protein
MMPSESKIANQSGFTLPEIIITLVAAGILSIFYIHFMGTAMRHSSKSVELVAGEANAEGVMERIISDYVEFTNYFPQTPPDTALKQIIDRKAVYESDLGGTVTMVYITYDSTGNASPIPFPGISNNLRVTVEAPGSDFTTILTNTRINADNPKVYY